MEVGAFNPMIAGPGASRSSSMALPPIHLATAGLHEQLWPALLLAPLRDRHREALSCSLKGASTHFHCRHAVLLMLRRSRGSIQTVGARLKLATETQRLRLRHTPLKLSADQGCTPHPVPRTSRLAAMALAPGRHSRSAQPAVDA